MFPTASLWYRPNLSTDLTVHFSKCYLLGRLCMTNTADCNWRCTVLGITLRSPQMETLMIVVFISASLWGRLVCESFGILPDKLRLSFGASVVVRMHFVINITQTQALTWILNIVSASCWGSVAGASTWRRRRWWRRLLRIWFESLSDHLKGFH